jgi:hypothetical protein
MESGSDDPDCDVSTAQRPESQHPQFFTSVDTFSLIRNRHGIEKSLDAQVCGLNIRGPIDCK